MGLTEKDVDFQYDTGYSLEAGMENFPISKLKYIVNSHGRPVLYIEKFKDKLDQTLDFESMVKMWDVLAERKADEAAKKVKDQVLADYRKKWRDFLKDVLKQATIAKKDFEEKLKQQEIDTKAKNWYMSDTYTGLFEE